MLLRNSKSVSTLLISLVTALIGACSTNPANTSIQNAASNNSVVSNRSNSNSNSSISAPASKGFSKTLELHGIKFVVESENLVSGNTVKVTPAGLEISNEPQVKPVVGEVYGAEIGDLDIDQSPEVYIYTRETGGNKKAGLIAYSANKKKSLSEINFPADDPKSKDLIGFNGGDEFAVVENSLVRRFSVYDGTSAEAKKTGKTRQIQYKLKPGEAMWQLVVDKVTEF